MLSESPEETLRFGRALGASLKSGDIVALCGELGAGKTLLTHGICEGIGYDGLVSSPSFLRLHQYPHDPIIYHADFYLLKSEEEIFDLGLEEIWNSRAITIVEWADLFPHCIPDQSQWIKIDWSGEGLTNRKIDRFSSYKDLINNQNKS